MCLNKLFSIFKSQATVERPSPKIRITPEQADRIIRALKLIPGYENCFVATLAPSNSMEPIMDDGMYVVLDPNVSHVDLIPGDIIWYEHPDFKAIHRIIEIGTDPDWYARCKGDNNSSIDPVKVRANQIKGVWRCTID